MASTYLNRAFSSGSVGTIATWSFWIKRSLIGSAQFIFQTRDANNNNYRNYFRFGSTDTFDMFAYNSSGTQILDLRTNRVFRDTSAWYHIVIAMNTTISATPSDRIKFYVNGVQETSFGTATYPTHNLDIRKVSSVYTGWGQNIPNNSSFVDGSMSHINFIDGTAYDATAFGSTDSTTGEWVITTNPSVTYGTNGYFILKDGNTITDSSPNSNNFSLGGGTLTKTEDNPSNVFATWNPLQATTSASYDFSAGNTRMAVNDATVFSLGATLAATTGKYYMEMKWVQQGGNGSWGMIPIDTDISNRPRNAGVGWNQGDNAPWLLGTIVSGSWGGSIGTNDIIQLAMDLDNGAFYFGKNDVWLNSGDPTSGASKTGAVDFSGTSLFGEQLTFAIGKGASGTDGWNANFGNGYIEQTPVSSAGTNASNNGIFEYDVPTGYTALSTKGLNL